jgi:hypothetical protein
VERKALARHLLAEIRRVDRDLGDLVPRITTTVTASGTTITDVYGVDPVVAAYLIGHTDSRVVQPCRNVLRDRGFPASSRRCRRVILR